MKILKYFFSITLLLCVLSGCKKDLSNDTSFASKAPASAKLSVLFDITQDNTGLVTITPNGEGAISYDIYYGDTATTPVKIAAGKNTTHTYTEGVYNVKIVGYNIAGKTTEATQPLTVSFKAPENLKVTVATNILTVNIAASAIYETLFKVYYGDSSTASPVPFTPFLEGQTVTHTYASAGTYIIKVVALSGGAATTTYLDTIKVAKQLDLPVSFDDANVDYSLLDFGGNSSAVAVDPASSTNKVMKVIKTAGAQVWGGTTLGGTIGFASHIPIAAGNTRMSIRVYSPAAGLDIKLKIEDHTDPTHSVETDVKTTVANQWETLVFDFKNQATGTAALNLAYIFDKASLFFDFGTAGSGKIFYADDLKMAPPSLAQIDLPVTFDDVKTDYTVTDFGGNLSAVTADPMNSGNNVMKSIKTSGAQSWAGTTVGTGSGFASVIPISASATKMSIRIFSPAAGLDIKLKIEEHTDGTHSVETDTKTTVANQWETLTFDFSNPAAGTSAWNAAFKYDKASLFFDFGNSGNGKAYYFDDLQMAKAVVILKQINLPVTFDDATVDYSVTDFGSNQSSLATDPVNSSNMVMKSIKTTGAQSWAGTTIGTALGFSAKIPVTASATKMSVKVYSPAAGLDIKLKIEDHNDGTHSVETDTKTTVANQWETLVFDFIAPAAGTSAWNAAYNYDKASIFFDFGNAGDGRTYYFDDVKFVSSGGGGGSLSQINLPVTFEDATVDYTVTDFGNNMTMPAKDPVSSSNNVKMTTKPAGAQSWAGTTIGTALGFATVIPVTASRSKMSVRVYSPSAGLVIKLKIEDHNDPTHSVETDVKTTLANQWETLVFDFSTPAAGTAAWNAAFTYDKASIFFDFGKAGSGLIFYWDDVKFL
jgi:hypothetical protein